MLLLQATVALYTNYYGGIFTVGVALILGDTVTSANALADYSWISPTNATSRFARCLTGLGPSGNSNGELGRVYFKGKRIPNRINACVPPASHVETRPTDLSNIPGAINIARCVAFSTDAEGIYTCTLRNSSAMDQSIRFGYYFARRSE